MNDRHCSRQGIDDAYCQTQLTASALGEHSVLRLRASALKISLQARTGATVCNTAADALITYGWFISSQIIVF